MLVISELDKRDSASERERSSIRFLEPKNNMVLTKMKLSVDLSTSTILAKTLSLRSPIVQTGKNEIRGLAMRMQKLLGYSL